MYLTVNETTYWYELNGEGEPVVLLHGFTGTSGTWKGLVSEWLHDYQTLIIDLPGHGRSEPGSPKSMAGFCHDLAVLLRHLDLNKVHLIGYSMGGRTALSFAMFYPEWLKSLTLESASAGLSDKEQRKSRRLQDDKLAQSIESGGVEAFVDYWETIPLFASQQQLPEPVQEAIRQERLSHSPEGLAQSLRFMGTGSQTAWWNDLPKLSVPVLLLSGEYDYRFIEINKMMADLMSSAQHKTVNHAGHAIHVEQPRVYGKIVTEFLKSV